MPRARVAFEIYGANIVTLRPPRLPVDRALVELAVLAGGGVDGVDVDDGHGLVQHLGPRLHQLAGLPVETGPLQEEAVDEDSLGTGARGLLTSGG